VAPPTQPVHDVLVVESHADQAAGAHLSDAEAGQRTGKRPIGQTPFDQPGMRHKCIRHDIQHGFLAGLRLQPAKRDLCIPLDGRQQPEKAAMLLFAVARDL
jgi:hypothetical protein